MSALRTGLLVSLLLAQLVAAAHIGFTQTSRSLENRIPKPDPKKYHSVQDAKDWKNPYLIVRRDGIEHRWNDSCGAGHHCRVSSRSVGEITCLGMALWLGRGRSGHRDIVRENRPRETLNKPVSSR